jgi:N-methylhydantoinase A
VLVPARPGLTNALGCVLADLRHDFVTTVNRPLHRLDMDRVHAILAAQTAEGRRLIAAEKVDVAEVRVSLSADMQFMGQTHLLRVPLPDATPSRDALSAAFAAAYFERFRVELAELRPALVNLNTSVIGRRRPIDLSRLIDPAGRAATLAEAETGRRRVWFESGWRDVPVYWRDRLPEAAAFAGPAIVEQMDATTVVEPGDRVAADADGNLIVTLGGAA